MSTTAASGPAPRYPRTTTAPPRRTPQSASWSAAWREERSMRIDRSRRTLRVLAVVAAASAALAACSSQGGAQNQAPAAGSGGGDTSGANLTIQMVTHEQAGDTFWDKIRAGAEDAAKSHGITLQYSNNENGPEQATLVQNAIDSKVSGLAVTLSNADAVIPVVAEGRRGRDPGGGVQPGHRRLQGRRRQDVLRLRRAAGRADRRRAPHRRERWRQDPVHHPGAGFGGAGDPLRRV